MEQQQQPSSSSPVRVFFRFRPMDKLETSKRSKDCIELHDNPTLVTIDSPLLGVSDFTFDQVFDEYAPQEEVYKETVSSIPRKLLVDGIDCTVMAYGQTSTGKTHTMLGERLGVELNERSGSSSSFLDTTSPNNKATTTTSSSIADSSMRTSSSSRNQSKTPDMTEGMIPRVVTQIFQQMKNTPSTTEYVVRCSYVEIYLEKIHDLLQPWRDNIQIVDDSSNILGVSQLCCVDPIDVYALLARGNAYRTKSSSDRSIDSSRSHAILTLRLEQIDHLTGSKTSSKLQMVDLAGSEVGGKSKPGSRSNKESPVVAEGKMINASLANLSNVIRGIVASQKKGSNKGSSMNNPIIQQPQSKLAKLLRPAFGSDQYTTIICTGSPSSYNIHETINTIKFGQQARQVMNYPSSNLCSSTTSIDYEKRRNSNLTTLVKLLAKECKSLKASSSSGKSSKSKDKAGSNNNQIWDVIQKISDIDDGNESGGLAGGDNLDISVSVKRIGESTKEEDPARRQQKTIQELEAKVEEYKLAKEKAESTFRDLQSDIVGLKSQNELLIKEKQRLEVDLLDSIEEVKNLANTKMETEHHLRTSQFREREAILFLRQFRTFYFRLLKNKAAHGSGGTKDITEDVSKKIPGVSDLSDLLDVDKVMVLSGLLENGDVGRDVGKDYVPSREALSRSSAEAKKAEHKEMDLISKAASGGGSKVSISNPRSVPGEPTYGQLTSYRQKLLESPAGRLAMKKERELEQDLTELAKKCATLQNSVIAEKAMVEALSARQGAMGKMKTAQELNTLKQELERKTNDLHAIVWKMNELHLVNKTIDTKVENREHHVSHLEDHVANIQAKNRKLLLERQEAEKKLREENQFLRNELDGMAAKIWQLGDTDPNRPQPWRSVVPYNGRGETMIDLSRIDDDEGRRLSLGELEPEEIASLVNQS